MIVFVGGVNYLREIFRILRVVVISNHIQYFGLIRADMVPINLDQYLQQFLVPALPPELLDILFEQADHSVCMFLANVSIVFLAFDQKFYLVQPERHCAAVKI